MSRQLLKKNKTFTPRTGERQSVHPHPLHQHSINQPLAFKALPGVSGVLRSPGHTLDTETRRFVEPLFSFDFSNVRIHTDHKAAESAKAMNAHAYTVGRDVVFRNGQYAPRTKSGKKLLGHELAHVVQQNTGAVPSPNDIIPAGSLHNHCEPEAVAAGNKIMNNQAPSGIKPGVNNQAVLQGSFLADIPIIGALYRLFGGESYEKEELEKYLEHLKTGEIEDNYDSDNKARAVVKRQDEFPSLDTKMKELLIREMLKGYTSGADEESIIRLLREAEPGERTKLVNTIGRPHLWDNFSYDNRIIIEAITLKHEDFLNQSLIDRLKKLSLEKLDLYKQNALDPAVRADINQVIKMHPISTPLGIDTQINEKGEAIIEIGHFRITIKPDAYDESLGDTSLYRLESEPIIPDIDPTYNKDGILQSWKDNSVFEVSLQTIYGTKHPERVEPTYGMGTRPEDERKGNKSIKFHESRHGFDILKYFSKRPHPRFPEKEEMTETDVQEATQLYKEAVYTYIHECGDYTTLKTDCVHIPIPKEMLIKYGRDPDFCEKKKNYFKDIK